MITEEMVRQAGKAVRKVRLRMDAAYNAPDPATEEAYDEFLARAALTAALSEQVAADHPIIDGYVEDLKFANRENIKAARKYKARLEYMEVKYGKIDWEATPPPVSPAGESR